MAQFIVFYLVPPSVIERWSKTEPAERKAAEDTMRAEWTAWMSDHAHAVTGTTVGGKTMLVSRDGLRETKNDIMLYAFVEAASQAAAATMFERHPHLQIPDSSIEIMEIRPMGGS